MTVLIRGSVLLAMIAFFGLLSVAVAHLIGNENQRAEGAWFIACLICGIEAVAFMMHFGLI